MANVTYITYLYPGLLFADSSVKKVKNRKIPKELPKGCVAFRFHSQEEAKRNGEVLRGEPKDHSPTHYIGKLTLAKDVPAEYPGERYRILRTNVECNKSYGVVHVDGNIWDAKPDAVIHQKDEFTFV